MKNIMKTAWLAVLTVGMTVNAQSISMFPEDTAEQLTQVTTRLTELEIRLENTEKSVKTLGDDVNTNAGRTAVLSDSINTIAGQTAAIKSSLNNAISEVNKKLGTEIETTKSDLNDVKNDTGSMKSYGFLLLGLVIVIVVALYLILRKRIGDGSMDLKAVKEANRRLEEQSVELDTKLANLLEQQLRMADSIRNAAAATAEPDHSLVLSIANELMRIEQNLAFMDPKTKGVSQLRNRAAAISSSLRKKGYEIPQLVGTEYNEGLNMEATMEEDDSIDSKKMIIRRVTRPAVLFDGKMIQSAAVAVAFNPEFHN